jgi:hypothetical protein
LNEVAVAEAFRITKGLPGHLLAWLHLAVEEAVRDNWPAIDADRLAAFAGRQPPRLPDEAPEATPLPPPAVELREEG